MNEGKEIYSFKNFRLDTAERQLLNHGKRVALTTKAFDVLAYMVERAGHLVEKDELMSKFWADSFVEEANVARLVHTLRKSLGDDANGCRFIETVPKKGYRFVGKVTKETASPVDAAAPELNVRTAGPEFPEQEPPHPGIDNIAADPAYPIKETNGHRAEPAMMFRAETGADDAGVDAAQARRLVPVFASLAIVVAAAAWFLLIGDSNRIPEVESGTVPPAAANTGAARAEPEQRDYREMTGAEQAAFIRSRAQYIQTLIHDDPSEFEERFMAAVKLELDDYVSRDESVSDRPFREPIRTLYERAAKSAEIISDNFESVQLPAALGIYQAMAESEFHVCLTSPTGSVGLFQLTKRTAALFDLPPDKYCDPEWNSDAAARYMADLSHEFGGGRPNSSLALFAYNLGSSGVQEHLRQLRRIRVWERSAWAILRFRNELSPPLPDSGERYLARFFAAAIIGETPAAFGLSSPPLTQVRTPRGP